jgi:vacuolar-type H+-ATPase subunit E/Vma4
MEKDNVFNELKEKIDLLESEKDKDKMRDLIIDIIVNLEKFCHRDNVQIHQVLSGARERCKNEIDKPY